MPDAKDIYSQFKKGELLEIAEELDITVDPSMSTKDIASLFIKDFDENGIPDDLSEISDKAFELLVVAEYIDEDGNIVEKEDDAEESTPEIPEWFCFSYADSRDPACNKPCPLYDACVKARIAKRPECFGMLYSDTDPECQSCIEAPFCKKEVERIEENG